MSDDLPWDDLSDGGQAENLHDSSNLDEDFPRGHCTGGGTADDNLPDADQPDAKDPDAVLPGNSYQDNNYPSRQ